MRLLIDISEGSYNTIKECYERGELFTTICMQIATGTPYEERPQGELKEYKPLEIDYNVKSAVENLKTAYWSNDSEKYAKAFTEADQMIVSAICHYGYTVCKQPQGEWIKKVDDVGFVSHICSECGAEIEVEDCSDDKFCFNCGADMRGEEE